MKRTISLIAIAATFLLVSCDKEESNSNATPTNDTTTANLLIVGGQTLAVTLTGTDLFTGGSERYYLVVGGSTSVMAIFNDNIPAGTSYTTTGDLLGSGQCKIVLQLNGGSEVYFANDGSTVNVTSLSNNKIKISFNTIGFTEVTSTGTPKTSNAKATFTCNKQ